MSVERARRVCALLSTAVLRDPSPEALDEAREAARLVAEIVRDIEGRTSIVEAPRLRRAPLAERKAAAVRLLSDPAHSAKSNEQIGRLCGLNFRTVRSIRHNQQGGSHEHLDRG